MGKEVLLEIKNLRKYFPIKNFFGSLKGEVKAVDDVSFEIYKGETFGLVGESGCGKSTLGRCILQMLEATDGQVLYKGNDLMHMSGNEWKKYRKKLQIIFQDPYSALNPNWNVKQLIEEPLKTSGYTEEEIDKRIRELLKILNMNEEVMEKFPYEFSGGQRQRIGVARAVAAYPEFIFCDEPISALDVSIQAQVVNMLKDLQKEQGLTYLFTAHDLSMVYHISDRIGVMYLGSMVEIGTSEDVFKSPLHPYTKALISAVPIADPKVGRMSKRIFIEGELPSPMNVPKGCRFCTRCPQATDKCKEEMPALREVKDGHFAACHYA
ncbi:MAG: oligopeptide/dipeptide ABC transporter ATP-binding protein [Schaedlerella sp.]|nr:oligopeptide/dipeptide ABC transporter ATP-binding protein [Schaedlerella sp.]